MAWQLRGLNDLFEAFSLSQDKGILDPHTEFQVALHFQAKQTGSIEKTLQLEVRGTLSCLAQQGTLSTGAESGRAAPDRHKGAVTPTSASTMPLPERAVHPHPPT